MPNLDVILDELSTDFYPHRGIHMVISCWSVV